MHLQFDACAKISGHFVTLGIAIVIGWAVDTSLCIMHGCWSFGAALCLQNAQCTPVHKVMCHVGGEDEVAQVKYLTSSRLLGLQLRDATFRRYLLTQALILLHHCQNPSKLEKDILKPKQLAELQASHHCYHAHRFGCCRYQMLPSAMDTACYLHPLSVPYCTMVQALLCLSLFWSAPMSVACTRFLVISVRINRF